MDYLLYVPIRRHCHEKWRQGGALHFPMSSGKSLRVKLTPSNLYLYIVKMRFEGVKKKSIMHVIM